MEEGNHIEPGKIFKDFFTTLKIWSSSMNAYSIEQLVQKPGADSWSLGQVCMHLVDEALNFNIPQLEFCLRSDENKDKVKTEEGERIYARNSFPPVKLVSPPNPDGPPQQPESMEQIRAGFGQVKKNVEALQPFILNSTHTGKSLHPGFGYLDAIEWVQFMEMHYRHHLRQKEGLQQFLQSKGH